MFLSCRLQTLCQSTDMEHQSLLFPLSEASLVSCIAQKSGGPCLLRGLHYHTTDLPRRPAASPPKVNPSSLNAVACGQPQVWRLHGVPLFSVLLVPMGSVLIQMWRVNRIGVKPCGHSILMETRPSGLG